MYARIYACIMYVFIYIYIYIDGFTSLYLICFIFVHECVYIVIWMVLQRLHFLCLFMFIYAV